MNFLKLLDAQAKSDVSWGAQAKDLKSSWEKPCQKGYSDKAHPPIYPLRHVAAGYNRKDYRKVFEIVVRCYLACLCLDTHDTKTTATVEVEGEIFEAEGIELSEWSPLGICNFENFEARVIPYEDGQSVSLEWAIPDAEPADLLSEVELLECMEKACIGTAATVHLHMEELQSMVYIIEKRGKLIPTYLGEALIKFYRDMDNRPWKRYSRLQIREDVEGICDGSLDKELVLKNHLNVARTSFGMAVENGKMLTSILEEYLGLSKAVAKCFGRSKYDMVLKPTKDDKFELKCCNKRCGKTKRLRECVTNPTVTSYPCRHCGPETRKHGGIAFSCPMCEKGQGRAGDPATGSGDVGCVHCGNALAPHSTNDCPRRIISLDWNSTT